MDCYNKNAKGGEKKHKVRILTTSVWLKQEAGKGNSERKGWVLITRVILDICTITHIISFDHQNKHMRKGGLQSAMKITLCLAAASKMD